MPSGENLDTTLKALVILAKAKDAGVRMTDKDAMSRVGATQIGYRVANWRSVVRKDDPHGRSVLRYICDELGIPENTTVGAKTDASAYTELPSTFALPDLSTVQAKKSAIMTVLKANRSHGVSVPQNLENLEKSLTALVYLDSASRQSFPSNVEPAAIAKAGVHRATLRTQVASWREHTVAGDPGGRSVLKYISDELGIAENTTIGTYRRSTGVVTVSEALEAEVYRVSPELVDQISVMLSGAGVLFRRDNLAVVLSTIKVVDAILRVPVAERGGLAALSVFAISKQLGFKARSNIASVGVLVREWRQSVIGDETAWTMVLEMLGITDRDLPIGLGRYNI